MIRGNRKRRHRAFHRQKRRLQDVERFNLVYRGLGDGDIGDLPQARRDQLALLARQDLGIVQSVRNFVRVQPDRSSDNRAGNRATTDLVDTDDIARAVVYGGLFE